MTRLDKATFIVVVLLLATALACIAMWWHFTFPE